MPLSDGRGGSLGVCPDGNVVVGYVEQSIDAPGRRRLENHLDGCSNCRRVIAELARASDRDATTRP